MGDYKDAVQSYQGALEDLGETLELVDYWCNAFLDSTFDYEQVQEELVTLNSRLAEDYERATAKQDASDDMKDYISGHLLDTTIDEYNPAFPASTFGQKRLHQRLEHLDQEYRELLVRQHHLTELAEEKLDVSLQETPEEEQQDSYVDTFREYVDAFSDMEREKQFSTAMIGALISTYLYGQFRE